MKSLIASLILVFSLAAAACAQDTGAVTRDQGAPAGAGATAATGAAGAGPAVGAAPGAAVAPAAAAASRPARVQAGGDGLPQYVFPASAKPGDLIRIYARYAGGIGSLSAVLRDDKDRRVSSASTFALDPAYQLPTWAALMGVPSTLAPGDYRIRCTITRGVDTFIHDQPLRIEARSFFSEDIPLTQALTDLRTVPDPRKTAQARELSVLLWSLHGDARFESGTFIKPVTYLRVSGGYGDRRVYKYSTSKSDTSVHAGMDYAQVTGIPVVACGQGRVVMATERISTGNTVVIEHQPGLYSLYFHMSASAVKTGDVVAKGQVIGKVGATGLATGAHLHWEVEIMGVPVDPEAFFTEPILDKSSDLDSIFSPLQDEGR